MYSPEIFAIIVASSALFGILSVCFRGRLPFLSAFLLGALLGPFGLLITILLSIQAELRQRNSSQPQSTPPHSRPTPKTYKPSPIKKSL